MVSSRSGTSDAGRPWFAAVFTPLNRWTTVRVPASVFCVKYVAWTHSGADTETGSGLRGLADRVEALGGRLLIWTPTGGGTRVRAEIPCA